MKFVSSKQKNGCSRASYQTILDTSNQCVPMKKNQPRANHGSYAYKSVQKQYWEGFLEYFYLKKTEEPFWAYKKQNLLQLALC